MALFGSMVILPTFLFLFTLSFDIAGFYNELNRAQVTVDDAALYAHNFLPDTQAAQTAAQRYVDQFSRLRGQLSTSSTSDSISLMYSSVYRWWLGAFFNHADGIPFTVSSSSGSAATHISILVDSSRYTAPASGEVTWGNSVEWREAPILSAQVFRNRNGEPVSAAHATQQCFNPVSRALKYSALSLLSYFSSFPKNSVGIGFFPGHRSAVELIQSTSSYTPSALDLDPNYLTVTHDVVRHFDCLLIARDIHSPEQYKTPTSEPEYGNILDGFFPDLPSRQELLWSRSVGEGSADIGEVLRTLEAELLGAQKRSESKSSGLSYRPTKLGVVLLGDMPRRGSRRFPDNAVKESLAVRIQSIIASQLGGDVIPQELRGALRLFFIILAHQEVHSAREEAEELQRFFDTLLTESHVSSENISLQVLYGGDPSGLAQAVIRSVVLQSRTKLLRR